VCGFGSSTKEANIIVSLSSIMARDFIGQKNSPKATVYLVIRNLQRVGDSSLALCPVLGTSHSSTNLSALEIFNDRWVVNNE
jgi:hypothetical protein